MNFKKIFARKRKIHNFFSIKKPKLDNYFFVKADGFIEKVVLDSHEMHVIGTVTKRPGVPDGSRITTSQIVRRTSNTVTTRSGSKYILGNPHPDFVDLKKAITENVPIITEWHLNGKRYLSGMNFLTAEPIEGIVVAQDGNYITLKHNDKISRYFVIWRNVDLITETHLIMTGAIEYETFKRQFSLDCVPNFDIT